MKDCSTKTHELVLTEYEKLTLIAKEETKKAIEWLSKQAKQKKKKDSIKR